MGSVWLAERCDGRFEGRAAVKLLNLALIGRAGEERFRREGNILARLTHPHIAHLIDAGVSPTGQPYLVLEHVDGQTIDRYCDEHALGIDARLRLFLDVLEAVAHAHANLIVHRDIKPANVLVSGRRAGQAARLRHCQAARGRRRVGASADGRGERADARRRRGADAGVRRARAGDRRPGHHGDRRLRARRAAVRAAHRPASGRARASARPPISCGPSSTRSRGGCPTRWSAATEPAEALARHAARCGTTPGRLRRTLHGDLDTIVAKALKKTRAGALPVGHGAGRRSAPLPAARADQRAARHAAVPDRDVRAAARARRGDGGRGVLLIVAA